MRNRAVVRADKAKAVRELYARLWNENTKLRMHVDPYGERRRIAEQEADFAEKAQAVPLSKRDPEIKRRWDSLFSDIGAAP